MELLYRNTLSRKNSVYKLWQFYSTKVDRRQSNSYIGIHCNQKNSICQLMPFYATKVDRNFHHAFFVARLVPSVH